MSQHPFELPESDAGIAEALSAARATPAPSFRGLLARRLGELDPGYPHRPKRLRSSATLLIALGVALVLLGGLVSIGII